MFVVYFAVVARYVLFIICVKLCGVKIGRILINEFGPYQMKPYHFIPSPILKTLFEILLNRLIILIHIKRPCVMKTQCDIEVLCSIHVLTIICLIHIAFLFPGQSNILTNAALSYIVTGI